MKKIQPDIQEARSGEYKTGFRIILILLVSGIFLEWISRGKGLSIPSYPLNVIIGTSFLSILFITYIFFRKNEFIKSLSSIPVALTAIIFFAILVLGMGIIKQDNSGISSLLKLTGINHIRRSYLFILSSLYILSSLGLVILKNLFPLKLRNIGFILVHTGIWILIYVTGIGTGDLRRLGIMVYEREIVWFGFAPDYRPVVLPFTMKLLDYRKEEYPAKLFLINKKDPTFSRHIQDHMSEIKEDKEINIKDWNIKVIQYIPFASKDSTRYRSSTDSVTTQAALVQVKNKKQEMVAEGWLSCRDQANPGDYLILDSTYTLNLSIPEAKSYSSLVEIAITDNEKDTFEIKVNKPLEVKRYKLYQSLFEDGKGKYSNRSMIEAVWDPWLPFVYAAIFMVIAGLFVLMITRLNSDI